MSSNSLMQVPTITKDAESFTQSPSSQSSTNNEHVKTKSKYRMRICDAPPEILELIRRSEIKNEQPLQNKFSVSNVASFGPGSRPSVNIFALKNGSIQNNLSISSSLSSGISYTPPLPKKRTSKTKTTKISKKEKKEAVKSKIKAKTKNSISKQQSLYKRGKRNSSYRAMTNNGISPTVVAGKIKPTRIPIPPPMNIEDLMKKIAQLNLDQNILNHITPNITWKGNPLFIGNSIHCDLLHPKEALVVSTLRLTPLQYLTYKFILISSARGYSQRSFPFRKSDAQKHLPIDVNKSSKLWEWFTQTGWLKTEI
ncbi:hypothetical protein C1646_762850 [Rhizophagus diaphanus]|nr:hypothetical protein C1646_762850 [Rhizophagus diaphanus] [Rhizophagus sp. MUCL 43196]